MNIGNDDENDDGNDDGNGWMKAGLPELGAPPFLFLSKCKGDRLNARNRTWIIELMCDART